MINFHDVTGENIKEHNRNWSQIPDYPCKVLITSGSGLRGKNALFNVTSHQLDIIKIYLYAKDKNRPKQMCRFATIETISKLLLTILRIWITFMKILKHTIQTKM